MYDVATPGSVSAAAGQSGMLIVRQNGALNLITLRYRLKDVRVQALKTAFTVGLRANLPA